MIWREKRILLGVLAALLLANAVFFLTYRVQYETRLSAIDERLHATEGKLQQTQRARMTAEAQVAAYGTVQKELQSIYNSRWASQRERLTRLIEEIKRLAVASQLIPTTYSFAKTEFSKDARMPAGTNMVSISYNVEGNYQQIRRLINLLELSNQFVIIDSLALGTGTGTGKDETMNIRLKTLFRDAPAPPPPLGNQEM